MLLLTVVYVIIPPSLSPSLPPSFPPSFLPSLPPSIHPFIFVLRLVIMLVFDISLKENGLKCATYCVTKTLLLFLVYQRNVQSFL